MAKITFTYKTTTKEINIPDTAVPRIIDGFALLGNYQENIQAQDEKGNQIMTPNPQTKQQFFLDGLLGEMKGLMLRADAAKVEKDALETVKNSYVAPTIS